MAAKSLQAGDLDRRIDILIKGTHKNSKGETTGHSYGPFLSGIWAQKTEKPGQEKPVAERETAFGRADFTVRYRTDIKETMRVLCEGTEYDIENVREGEGRKQWTVLECQKRD